MHPQLIYDIGMYDGSDTQYFLSQGHRVVGVEANPDLVQCLQVRFQREIESGRLVIVNKAVSDQSGVEVELHIAGKDLGSTSLHLDLIREMNPIGSHVVKTTTIDELMLEHGYPHYLKVDIEGSDRHCILPLRKETRPAYVSFEVGDDFAELINHLVQIGFSKFKAINQCNFLELSNQDNLSFRIKRKIVHLLGYKDPRSVKLNGRYFVLGHSSGPAPWASDGEWQHADKLLELWRKTAKKGELGGWYDIHAC